MNKVCSILILLLSLSCFSQGEELHIPEVNVSANRLLYHPDSIPSLTKKEIEQLQPTDVGDLVSRFPGVQLRSYGGIGGLKTISVRGFGSQHTSVVLDGFAKINSQTGQINLSQLQTDYISNIKLFIGSSGNQSIPVSSEVFGSILSIESTNSGFHPTKKNRISLNSSLGSFDLYDNSISFKHGGPKSYIAAQGKIRSFQGAYPFLYQNYQHEYRGIRKNNDLISYDLGIFTGIRLRDKHSFEFRSFGMYSHQGLPGAVVLYLPQQHQELTNQNLNLQLDYNYGGTRSQHRVYSSLQLDSLYYVDTNYLNSAGALHVRYFNRNLQTGWKSTFQISPVLMLKGGVEHQYSDLSSNTNAFHNPVRNHFFSFSSLSYEKNHWFLEGQINSQYVHETTDLIIKPNERKSLNFFASIRRNSLLNRRMGLNSFYRSSMRIPGFNELYYNSIGNKDLLPEKIQQLSLGITVSNLKRLPSIGFSINAYSNLILDKIVAIPTKNLFVWSIQNVDKVFILGSDFQGGWQKKYQQLLLSVNGSYSFQRCMDVTDQDSPTYLHQIAYYPLHSGNFHFMSQYKSFGVLTNFFAVGERYSLNENIKANLIEAFTSIDIGAFYELHINSHKFRLQLSVKNIGNRNYSFIRNYLMPGRNYLVSLSYNY